MRLFRMLGRWWRALIPADYTPTTSMARKFERLDPSSEQDVIGNQFRGGQ